MELFQDDKHSVAAVAQDINKILASTVKTVNTNRNKSFPIKTLKLYYTYYNIIAESNEPIRISTIDIIELPFYYRIKLSSFGHSERPFRIMLSVSLLHTLRIYSLLHIEKFNSELKFNQIEMFST